MVDISSGREGVSEIHTKPFDLISLVVQGNGAGVRKCLPFGLNRLVFVDSKFVMSGPVFNMTQFSDNIT